MESITIKQTPFGCEILVMLIREEMNRGNNSMIHEYETEQENDCSLYNITITFYNKEDIFTFGYMFNDEIQNAYKKGIRKPKRIS